MDCFRVCADQPYPKGFGNGERPISLTPSFLVSTIFQHYTCQGTKVFGSSHDLDLGPTGVSTVLTLCNQSKSHLLRGDTMSRSDAALLFGG